MTNPALKAEPGPQSDETSALAEIVEWAKALPAWQSDALRRLCAQSELDPADLDALTEICKGNAAFPAAPIAREHVRDSTASAATIVLKGVHSVQYVNALAAGEQLTFDKIGVTVIYGDNGSGKSGYARILKKACRARASRGETVHQNIYATTTGTPTAVLDFTVNGSNRSEMWLLGKSADPYLSAISVFDSRSANVHVDQTNDLAYTPLPLKILSRLAQVSQTVKERLGHETKRLQDQTPAALKTPACQPGTRVGKLMKALVSAKPLEVEQLAFLTPDELSRLAALRADLAADPARAGQSLQALKRRVDDATKRVEQMASATSDDKVAALRSSYKTYKATRAAAHAASTALFSGEPLPSIGSDAWRELWVAARAYAEKEAYVGQAFPATSAGARCVLCLQELSAEASTRFTRFEAFVKDQSEERESEARAAYEACSAGLRPLVSRIDRHAITTLIRDELGDVALAGQVRRSLSAALRRGRMAIRSHQAETESTMVPALAAPSEALQFISQALQTRATALLSEATAEPRKQLISDRDELADREWLGGLKHDVLLEIERQKSIAALDKAAKETTTNRITAKSSELAEKLVTNALRAKFAQEVNQIGVAGLAIELRKEKSELGVPLFRVALIKKPLAKVGDVLSEGEHRCVALAAFLAELATTSSHSSIVFDDPVSSLDHLHREAVAGRLADEGLRRQVIVLTHDIAFLFLLHEACRAYGTHVAFRSINRGKDFAGFCQPNPPPNAQPVDKVIESMRKQLDNQKIHHTRGNQEEWYRTVRSLQEQLRTTWERCVEEALSPVIRRLANKVDTKGLSKITAVTLDDCRTMREAFGRCSALLHSVSEALNPPLPQPAAIEAEIKALGDWMTSMRARQKDIGADA